MTNALRGLRDRERVLLQAYIHFATAEAARSGRLGVCWPTDAEVAAYLGRSVVTVRRSRTVLATMAAPFIALRYVAPFAALPDGTMSLHGQNVVMLLGVGASEEAQAVGELVAATTALRTLERDVVKAKAHVDALTERVGRVRDQAAANDDAAPAPAAASVSSSHNAPSLIIPGWSPRKAPAPAAAEREGESRVA